MGERLPARTEIGRVPQRAEPDGLTVLAEFGGPLGVRWAVEILAAALGIPFLGMATNEALSRFFGDGGVQERTRRVGASVARTQRIMFARFTEQGARIDAMEERFRAWSLKSETLFLIGTDPRRYAVGAFDANLRNLADIIAGSANDPFDERLALALAAVDVPAAGVRFLKFLIGRERAGIYLSDNPRLEGAPEERDVPGECHVAPFIRTYNDRPAREIELAYNAILAAAARTLIAERSSYSSFGDEAYGAAENQLVYLPNRVFAPTHLGRAFVERLEAAQIALGVEETEPTS